MAALGTKMAAAAVVPCLPVQAPAVSDLAWAAEDEVYTDEVRAMPA